MSLYVIWALSSVAVGFYVIETGRALRRVVLALPLLLIALTPVVVLSGLPNPLRGVSELRAPPIDGYVHPSVGSAELSGMGADEVGVISDFMPVDAEAIGAVAALPFNDSAYLVDRRFALLACADIRGRFDEVVVQKSRDTPEVRSVLNCAGLVPSKAGTGGARVYVASGSDCTLMVRNLESEVQPTAARRHCRIASSE